MMSTGTGLNVVKKVTHPRFELKEKGKLILSNELQAQIAYSHKQVGNIEWIGILLYRKIEGDIDAPKTLVLQAEKFFLMDIGTSGHTDAIVDADELCNLHDANPDIIDNGLCQGLIHTHHSMQTFFSGEDWSELNDNTESHNYYLSLIVNNAGPYAAKVAYMADIANKWSYKNAQDVPVVSETTTKYMVTMDLDIFLEDRGISQSFMDRHTYIKDKVAAAKVARNTYIGSMGHWSGSTWVPAITGWKPTNIGFTDNRWANVPNQGELGLVEEDPQEYFRGPSSTFAKRARGNKKSGKKHKQPQYYREQSDTLTDRQARDIALTWLNLGLEVETYEAPVEQFRTLTEALGYFASRYKKALESEFPYGDDNFRYFLDCMQKALIEASAEYKPSVTAKRVSAVLQDYAGHTEFAGRLIAMELAIVATAHPIFLKVLRENEKQDTFKQEKREEEWK